MASKKILFAIGMAAVAIATALALAARQPKVYIDVLDVGQGDAVLIRSGRSKLWGRPEYQHDMLNMTPETTEWLIRQGARVLGTDACVWEVDQASRPENLGRRMAGADRFPSHALQRRYDFLILENLANLDQVPTSHFLFVGLPLRLVGGSGSPVRAAAILPG